ncbi:MAG: choice-of-anchor Q domain-containing protein, partial [Planctomycetaceae bacterium]
MDGDGDTDILSTSLADDTVAWHENDGTQNFNTHAITTAADGAISVFAADVDADGDIDVLSASRFDITVAWYENLGFDFGDAPTPYPTPLNESGPRHIATGPMLGATRDTEVDGTHSANADADGADEDGIAASGPLIVGQTTDITINVQGGSGFVNAWADLNRDNDWNDLGEQFLTNQVVVVGDNVIPFSVPANSTSGSVAFRYRLTSASVTSSAPTGLLPDGEVEDYVATIQEAASLIVTTNSDSSTSTDGLTSLREAIAYANSDPDASVITFGDGSGNGGTNFLDNAPDTITLIAGEMVIATSLTITGQGAAKTIIDGGWDGVEASATGSRILVINDGAATQQVVTITGVTLQRAKTGTGSVSFNGGAISNAEQLTLTDSIIRDNLANEGVAIHNTGSVNSSRNTFTGNTGNSGTVFNQTGEFVSTGDTFDHNILSGLGGGFYNAATLTLINSTIANNTADAGGAIFNTGPATTVNVTIANNIANLGAGFVGHISSSVWQAHNTILAGNAGGDYIANGLPVVVADHLLVGDNTLTGAGITGNVTYAAIFGTNVLADNGGPTQTIALASGSVASNAGSNVLAVDENSQPLTTDQRGTGFARILGGIVDIGAFERANSTPTDVTLSANTIDENAGANVVVGALAGVDPDPNDALSLSLPTGLTDNSLFNINGGNLRANGSFNFESLSSYTVTVRVTDFDGLSFDKQFTISVTDVNEAPTAVALQNTTTSLAENTSTATAIKLADISVTDDALGTN